MAGNGDLHSNDAGFSLPGWSYSTANNTFLLEWGTGSPGPNPYGVSRSETGRQAVIINYDGTGVGDAPLAQTFNTAAGHQYVVRFGLSEENLYHTNSPTQLRVDVAAASYVISLDKPAPSGVTETPGSNHYTDYSFEFSATSTTTTVKFWDVTSSSFPFDSAFLDNVSVTAAPTVATITSVVATGSGIDSNGNGDVGAGSTVTLTVDFSENVIVDTSGGVPYLRLSNGATATYAGGSGTSALAFSYVVAAGQNTLDLAVKWLALNRAEIVDGTGNNANISGAAVNPAGILQIKDAGPMIVPLANGETETIAYNADGSIHDIAYSGVTGRPYTSYDVLYGGNDKPASASYSNGMTESWTYYPSGVLEQIQFQNVTGKPYTALENDYDTSGKLAVSIATNIDGSKSMTAHESGLTLAATGGTETLSGGGNVGETFLFGGAFVHATIADFAANIAGPNHDTVSLPGAAFNNSFAQLLAATTFSKSGALITVDANDTVAIPKLTQAVMAANPGSFSFHT